MPRRAIANAVKPLFDRREASLDHRFEFQVGENVGPVVFDAFADEFADVKRINALRDAVLNPL